MFGMAALRQKPPFAKSCSHTRATRSASTFDKIVGNDLLHLHDVLAEQQLTHSLQCSALPDNVIGHGDQITASALER
jgi:hypothetical protein